MVEELQELYIEPEVRALRLQFWEARIRLRLEDDDRQNRTDYVQNPDLYRRRYNRRLGGYFNS